MTNYETTGGKIKRRITDFLTRQNESEEHGHQILEKSKSNTITSFR